MPAAARTLSRAGRDLRHPPQGLRLPAPTAAGPQLGGNAFKDLPGRRRSGMPPHPTRQRVPRMSRGRRGSISTWRRRSANSLRRSAARNPGSPRPASHRPRCSQYAMSLAPAHNATIAPDAASPEGTGTHRAIVTIRRCPFAKVVRPPAGNAVVDPHPAGMAASGADGVEGSRWRTGLTTVVGTPAENVPVVAPYSARVVTPSTHGAERESGRGSLTSIVRAPTLDMSVGPYRARMINSDTD